jgi:exopolyphosphatase/guanosine-5'-triphosphate,3'-diphosphate pyrophosphatase
MRLLIVNIVEQGKEPQFNKSSLVRVPIRLGQDALVGEISDENLDRMCDAMKAFNLLMKVHKVERLHGLLPRQCESLQW